MPAGEPRGSFTVSDPIGSDFVASLAARSRVPASHVPDMIGWSMAIQMAEGRDAGSPPSSENHQLSQTQSARCIFILGQ